MNVPFTPQVWINLLSFEHNGGAQRCSIKRVIMIRPAVTEGCVSFQ